MFANSFSHHNIFNHIWVQINKCQYSKRCFFFHFSFVSWIFSLEEKFISDNYLSSTKTDIQIKKKFKVRICVVFEMIKTNDSQCRQSVFTLLSCGCYTISLFHCLSTCLFYYNHGAPEKWYTYNSHSHYRVSPLSIQSHSASIFCVVVWIF